MKTQRLKVLQLLQEHKSAGVNSYDLTYVYSIKQAPTRIKELKEEGYVITSQTLANRSVQYILNGAPAVKAKREIKYWNNGKLEVAYL